MSAWEPTKGLTNLRNQVNVRFPHRDKTSDGSIGNAAHEAETSGHNPDDTPGSRPAWDGDPDKDPEVRAWDMDSDLGEPGTDAQDVVDHILKLPNLASVIRYIIYNHYWWHERDGWTKQPYTGASKHEEHIHFEGAWSQAADNNTSFNYRLDELGDAMPLTGADAGTVLNADIVNSPPGSKNADGSPNTKWSTASYLYWTKQDTLQIAAAVKALQGSIAALEAKVAAPAVITQEQLDLAVLNALKTLAGGQG